MIAICPKCQNYKWDKEVVNDTIRCPKCGMTWQFKKRPLYPNLPKKLYTTSSLML